MPAHKRLIYLRHLGLARLARFAHGAVCAGVVPLAGECHDVAHLAPAALGRCSVRRSPAAGRLLSAVLRYAVAANVPPVHRNGAALHAVGVVALNDGDACPADLFHNAHMIGAAGTVSHAAVLPIVENIVAGLRHISVVLLPAPQLLEQLDVLSAAALRRDDVGHSRRDGDGACERAAPCVRVLHGVATGQRLVTVVQVDDLPVASVALFASDVALGDAHDLLPLFLFRHGLSSASCGAPCRILVVILLAERSPPGLRRLALICRALKFQQHRVRCCPDASSRFQHGQHRLIALPQLFHQEIKLHFQIAYALSAALGIVQQLCLAGAVCPLSKAIARLIRCEELILAAVHRRRIACVGHAKPFFI